MLIFCPLAHIPHLLGRKCAVVNRYAANLPLEEVSDTLIDEYRADGEVRAVVADAIGEVVWILDLTQPLGVTLETRGVVYKLLLALLEATIII